MSKFISNVFQKVLYNWRNDVTIKAFEEASISKDENKQASKITNKHSNSDYFISFSSLAIFATEFEKIKNQHSVIVVNYKSTNLIEYNKLHNDIDFILRIVAKNEDEYQKLRKHIQKILELIQFNSSSYNNKELKTTEATSLFNSQNNQNNNATQYVNINLNKKDINLQLNYEKLILNFNISFVPSNSISESKLIDTKKNKVSQSDPLVIDLIGQGYEIINYNEGAKFDINADGKLDRTSWIRGMSGLLVFDKNNNGKIDNGRELFGEQNSATNGFLELSKYDDDKNEKIDSNDSIYKNLRVYLDLNNDRKIQNNELFSLSSLGIKAIYLNFVRKNQYINNNKLLFESFYELEDGTKRKIGDFAFNFE